ncbi:MAG: hypothetical protein ACI97A_003521 [Planctomycetota bacterium]|jgi:hypothetical protein
MSRMSGIRQAIVQGFIASSIFIVVAIVATPTMNEIVEDGKSLKILRLYERLSVACAKHHKDTGKVASEFASSSESDRRNLKMYHQLSVKQLYSGWQGPYIQTPISQSDNPFGGSVELHNNLSTHPALGFELADGTTAHEGGQYLVLTNIPEEVAERLDRHLDSSLANGDKLTADWETKGRVEYSQENGGTLSLFILNVPE